MYQRGDNIKQGDWIYFKQNVKSGHSKWEGPVKVVAKDKKSLYVVRGGRFRCINSDDSQLAAFEGSFEGKGISLEEKVSEDGSVQKSTEEAASNENINNATVCDFKNNKTDVNSASTVSKDLNLESIGHSQTESVVDDIAEASVSGELVRTVDESNNDTNSKENFKSDYQTLKLKRNDVVRYKENDEWVEVQLTSRAGKVGSKYDSWWNIKNLKTGHESHEDLSCKLFVERIDSHDKVREEDVVYVVQIPRYRHHESICRGKRAGVVILG